jgi:acyl-CoA synthetase (NDP forming)
VHSALIFAAGFAEAGARDAQVEMTRMAREGGLAIVGPNCLGFTNNVDGIEAHLLFSRKARTFAEGDKPGLALIGQSGGLLGHLQRGTDARGIPVSYVVSTGNEAGLESTDFIEYLIDDRATSVISIYAEQIARPQAFLDACRRARAAGKAIVMMHPGRSAKARTAAQSHTGALAGDYATMLAHVERAGVLIVKTIDELMDAAEVLVRFPVPPVKGAAVLTASGAIVGIINDFADEIGLDLPELEPATLKLLTGSLPDFGTYGNPLDITTAYAPDNLPAITKALLDDANIGMLMFSAALGVQVNKLNEGMGGSSKPIVLTLLGDGSALPPPIAEAAAVSPAIISRSTDRMLRTAANLIRYGRSLARTPLRTTAEPFENLPALGRGAQPEWLGKKILAAAGIRVPAGDLARTVDKAIAVAARVGYPVALKAQAAALAHKTEAGGVALNVGDEAALRSAWETMTDSVKRAAPDVVLDGVLVEKMSPKGIEMMVGAKREREWGTVLLLGLGGIWVEALGDVQILAGDADETEILEALRRLRSAKLLDGVRGAPAADVAAIAQTVLAIGRLMRTVPAIVEIDVNPLMVHGRGQGVTALDALIVTQDG